MAETPDYPYGRKLAEVKLGSLLASRHQFSFVITMGVDTVVAVLSMTLAVLALIAAIAQVNIQASIEARRKGKTDKLAIGEWAINWPQLRLAIYLTFNFFFLPAPLGDPRILSVPFITLAALEDCLRSEAQAFARQPLQRRMVDRLVKSATESIATGAGRFTGRMYAVRATTRKRSEACWSDAMDMCGITRRFWPLLTRPSAQACDGAIRPANAVTNLHSLLGFARAMGLRQVEKQGTRITMTNGGASIYLDQYAGVDRPTRLAHFSGSPNGRYSILEEMSQHTAESIYAEAVWADGCIPLSSRLDTTTRSQPKDKQVGKRHIAWPRKLEIPHLPRGSSASPTLPLVWARNCVDSLNQSTEKSQLTQDWVPLLTLIDSREAAIVSCPRTFPLARLSVPEIAACKQALLWCVENWWLDSYQQERIQYSSSAQETPRIPLPDTEIMSCEFVTCFPQAVSWCNRIRGQESVSIDPECWTKCVAYASKLTPPSTPGPMLLSAQSSAPLSPPVSVLSSSPDPHNSSISSTSTLAMGLDIHSPLMTPLSSPDSLSSSAAHLSYGEHEVLVKMLQGWKLQVIAATWASQPSLTLISGSGQDDSSRTDTEAQRTISSCLVALLTMALLAIARDNSDLGSNEANKALEIELGWSPVKPQLLMMEEQIVETVADLNWGERRVEKYDGWVRVRPSDR